MKKTTAIILFIFLILAQRVRAEININDAANWVQDQVSDGAINNDIVDTATGALGLAAVGRTAQANQLTTYLQDNKNSQGCWPQNGCRVKDTALTAIALANLNKDSADAIDWLQRAQTGTLQNGEWFLQVITQAQGTCKINYLDGTNEQEVTVQIQNGRFPACQNSTFLNLNTCLRPGLLTRNPRTSVQVDCRELEGTPRVATTFKKQNSYYIFESEQAEQADVFIRNACYGQSFRNTCHYESSLYANWALKETNQEENVDFYLLLNYEKTSNRHNALLYQSLQRQAFIEELKEKQRRDGSWDRDVETTALTILALRGGVGTEQSLQKALDWLETKQTPSGSFESARNTALVLWAVGETTGVVATAQQTQSGNNPPGSPTVTFVSPTPQDNAQVNSPPIQINITTDRDAQGVKVELDRKVNLSMEQRTPRNFFIEINQETLNSDGNYIYRVFATSPDGVTARTAERSIKVGQGLVVCTSGGTRPCTKQAGVCSGTVEMCINGFFRSCSETTYSQHNTSYQGTETSCDRIDNDCDGNIDQGCSCVIGNTRACGQQEGLCQGVNETCTGGQWPGCDYQAIPKYESEETSCSDSLDNDCNGRTDLEDLSCQEKRGTSITDVICDKDESCEPERGEDADNCPSDCAKDDIDLLCGNGFQDGITFEEGIDCGGLCPPCGSEDSITPSQEKDRFEGENLEAPIQTTVEEKGGGFPWLAIFIIILIGLGVFFFYRRYYKKPEKDRFDFFKKEEMQQNPNEAQRRQQQSVWKAPIVKGGFQKKAGDIENQLEKSLSEAKKMLKRK